MSAMFEELDYRPTPLGALSLRRRRDLATGEDIFEIKLGDAFLMSSKFTASEVALAGHGLAALGGRNADVVVGGLGLGYTAHAALRHANVASLVVVELFEPVISWHRGGLLPLGAEIAGDARCRLVQGDFFELAAQDGGFDPDRPGRRFDAVLLDIDHTPGEHLSPQNAAFYTPEGLRALGRHLAPGGVFGVWSNEAPDDGFTGLLANAFDAAWAEPVTFDNPLQNRPVTQTVYLARTPD